MTQLTRALFAANVLAACSADNPSVDTPAERELALVGRDVSITVSDDADAQRFHVIIHSLSDRGICFDATAWDQGQIRFAGETVSVIDGAGAAHSAPMPAPAFAQASRLAPHAAVRSSIGYDQIPAEALATPGPHMLLLSDQPYFCESGASQ